MWQRALQHLGLGLTWPSRPAEDRPAEDRPAPLLPAPHSLGRGQESARGSEVPQQAPRFKRFCSPHPVPAQGAGVHGHTHHPAVPRWLPLPAHMVHMVSPGRHADSKPQHGLRRGRDIGSLPQHGASESHAARPSGAGPLARALPGAHRRCTAHPPWAPFPTGEDTNTAARGLSGLGPTRAPRPPARKSGERTGPWLRVLGTRLGGSLAMAASGHGQLTWRRGASCPSQVLRNTYF